MMSLHNVQYFIIYHLEDENLLDPNDEIHLFCLHHVFLSRIKLMLL